MDASAAHDSRPRACRVARLLHVLPAIYPTGESKTTMTELTDKRRQWLKISLDVPHVAVESVSDLLGVISGVGVEVLPPGETATGISAFFAVEPEPGQEPDRTAAAILDRVSGELAALLSLYDLPVPALEHRLLEDEDWATSWQRFFTPFEIVPGLVIRPSWETCRAGTDQQVLEMDPGMAFGTGQHASTRMALALVTETCRQQQPAAILDVGTGTGILAMAAVLFGARRAVAIDNDPEAVRVARDNIRINRLQDRIRVSGTDLEDCRGPFPLICANIVHDVLVDMAPAFRRLLAPGGRIVLAGILRGNQEKSISRAYARLGLQTLRTLHTDEWAALLLLDTSR